MTASNAVEIGGNGGAPAETFVINLAASTSPMALSHPTAPELKRYTFFVSRQRQDGRERFRLHMGYFATQEEAEALLVSIRDVYPAAWAGPAPSTGVTRRGRIAPGAVVPAAPVAAAMAAQAVPAQVVQAQVVPAQVVPAPSVAAPSMTAPPTVLPAVATAPAIESAPLEEMSNVRDVIAELSEAPVAAARAAQNVVPQSAVSRAAPQPVAPKPAAATPELTGVDALRLLEDVAPRPLSVAAIAPAARPVATAPAQTAATTTVVAPVLPAAAAKPAVATPALPPLKNPFEGLENEPEVRLVTPEDTQTLTDIKVDRQNNAPPCFAVQLIWSPSPIDVGALSHLAIFDAYTLYNVEGNRQGRKWYGLRLGFFTDPNSATQVANYVRSDYKNVAVVPVAVKERDRARGGAPLAASEVQKTTDGDFRREAMDGFELLTDDRPAVAKRDIEDTVRAKAMAPQAGAMRVPAAPVPTGKPGLQAPQATPAVKAPTGKRVVARRRSPQLASDKVVSSGVGGAEVLESTLEILGASTLSLEDGGRELITDAASRKPSGKSGRAGRFSKLLSRLSGN